MVNTALFSRAGTAFRTQYAELKERVACGGTPTSWLTRGAGAQNGHWIRILVSAFFLLRAGKAVGSGWSAKTGDAGTLQAMREQIAFSGWVLKRRYRTCESLVSRVADKSVARVLVELHNRGAFEAGMVLVGTLGYMAWLNELGATAVSARTLDIDLARRQQLKLATPISF